MSALTASDRRLRRSPTERTHARTHAGAGAGPTVADRMSSPAIVIPSDVPAAAASDLLAARGITGLPVVDPTGALVGVISEVDLALVPTSAPESAANGAGSASERELLVRHLMSAPAVTVHPTDPVASAARRMARHAVRRLVVVTEEDELHPVGVVTAGDLAGDAPSPSRSPSPRGAPDA